MFDELTKYKNNDHFFFTPDMELNDVCNAPKKSSGIYLVYELKNGRIELVYIGSSGKVQDNGQIKHRNGGIFDWIVNGHQFGKIPRKKSWKQKLIEESNEAIDIYGQLPKWNKEI